MPDRKNPLVSQYPAVFHKLQHRLNERELDITALTLTVLPPEKDEVCTLGVRPCSDSAESFREAFGEMSFPLPAAETGAPGPKVADIAAQLISRYKEALAAVPR